MLGGLGWMMIGCDQKMIATDSWEGIVTVGSKKSIRLKLGLSIRRRLPAIIYVHLWLSLRPEQPHGLLPLELSLCPLAFLNEPVICGQSLKEKTTVMENENVSRRQFVGTALAGALLSGVRMESKAETKEGGGNYRLFWGDLHNHNAVGYGKGSLQRSIELARAHLDFFAFTGHASWHDMPKMPGDRHMVWVNGFEANKNHWPKTRQMLRDATTRDFAAFLGYEWHSSQFGDYCLLFPADQPELFLPDHVEKLLDFAAAKKALAIPHHVAYKLGWRGANFKQFRPQVSPVIEIFSEHGCTESDRAPYPMLTHSNGGRSTANTVQVQLAKGLRFGFVASTDDHSGYPGAYGEGVVGVWARELTPAALFEAIRARRTFAATGDRISLEVQLNGQPMGSELPSTGEREFDVRVEGQDALAMIELVRNGRVIARDFPEDRVVSPPALPGRVKCRLQFGWGPWGQLALDRVCPWDLTLTVQRGKLHRVLGCFQAAPFGEEFRDRLQLVSETEVRLQSQTTRKDSYREDPTKSLVLELTGDTETTLIIKLRQPSEQTVKARLADLISDNLVTFTGGFTTESYILGRLIGPAEYGTSIRWHDRVKSKGPDYYYVRVTQQNGHMAWSSPIWVG